MVGDAARPPLLDGPRRHPTRTPRSAPPRQRWAL